MIRFSLKKNYEGMALDVSAHSSAPVLALFGPSGAGKSTILKMIAGMVTPDHGEIRLHDSLLFDSKKGINLKCRERKIGYVPQHGLLFPHLSVERNITFSQWAGHRRPKMELARLAELLGIGKLLDRNPADLSGGERQRVALARALYSSPALLLMDEPLSALDDELKGEALSLIETVIHQFEIPAIYVSHSLDEVLRIADDMAVMRDGKISEFGNAMELTGRLDGVSGLNHQILLEGEVEEEPGSTTLGRIKTRSMEFVVASDLPKKGAKVKVRIDPRDVMLALDEPGNISAQNRFSGVITRIEPLSASGAGSRMVLVYVATGGEGNSETLVSRITIQAAEQLQLRENMPVHAIIKTVALLDQL